MHLETFLDTPPWEWPKNAAQIFHSVLVNPHATPSDRLTAAGLAGDYTVINDQLAADLLAILRNPKEPGDLRARAAIAFGPALEQAGIEEFIDPEDVPISEKMFNIIQAALHKSYLDPATPKLVRRRVLEVSVRATAEWHRSAIEASFANPDPEWKLTAVFGMRHVKGFAAQILEALNSTDPLKSTFCCCTMPICRWRDRLVTERISRPSIKTSPAVGR